jgi:branched-chain amino acid transport system ATP-binding protein
MRSSPTPRCGKCSCEVPKVLELVDMHAYYGRSHIVQGVSMRVPLGEGVGLVGHNGVGKTTTLRSIMADGPRTEGKIVFKGDDLAGAATGTRVRKGLGLVPDEGAVFPRMSVEENIRIGALLRGGTGSQQALDLAYELFPILSERRIQMAGTLSGGEQKMLALARGLALRPELILVDEPSEGLMPINVELIAAALRRAVRAGTGVLVVDASFDLLKQVCDRVYVMQRGLITGDHLMTDFAGPDKLVATYLGEQ